MSTATAPELAQAPPIAPRLAHIVEKVPGTQEFQDKCLCGFIWDALFVSPNMPPCEECIEIFKRRMSEGSQ